MHVVPISPPERIATPFGCLRRPQPMLDAEPLRDAIWNSREHLTPWEPWAVDPANSTVEFQEHRLNTTSWAWDHGTLFVWLIIAEDGTLAGGVHLEPLAGGIVESGYWLRSTCTGQGFATRSLQALLPVAASLPQASVVQLRADEANERSNRVPQRLGFTLANRTFRAPQTCNDSGVVLTWHRDLSAYKTAA